MKEKTVAIIGAGIAGPVTALALHKAGIAATVYESYPSTADGLGGTIAIAPNGMAALEIVGAADAVREVASPAYRQVMSVNDKRVAMPSLDGVEPLRVVRRSDLYRILQERARAEGVPIEYGRRLTDVREESDRVTAIFDNGEKVTADVIVGADGVHSTVRRLIDPDAPGPRYTGMLAFEGLSPAEVAEEAGTMTFAFGKRGYYLYWPAAGGGTTFGVNLPHPRPLSIKEARAVPSGEWIKTLLDVYGEDEPGGDLLRNLAPEDLQVNGALYIMPPVPHWYRGRMALVGDAVHAPSNSSGQGASLAIESSIQLARCLRDIPDVQQAFATYERLRRDRVERIASRAAKINHTKAPGPVAKALMPVIMPIFLKLVMKPEKTMGPDQRYRIDWPALTK
ncbi:FAD-dependent oxidoreductase [Paractinoplanes globisporus]|uniref:FAD-dependent oxidoreductase n=1 Tax=Paractinoplanes globisporus TaxID=113565 RepID=A0ABW6WN25_9ACTN|nr:NAD(P)/FAD-dependent oxidoreductase [Actinoplanes globisporus]